MPEYRPLRVFLCHAAEDQSQVRLLYEQLQDEEWIEPWLEIEKLFPRTNWRQAIREAIEASDSTLLCLSRRSVRKNGFVHREMRYALEVAFGNPEEIVSLRPVRLEHCEVPGELQFFHWIDYFGDQKEEYYQILLKSLRTQFEALSRTEDHESLDWEHPEAAEDRHERAGEREEIQPAQTGNAVLLPLPSRQRTAPAVLEPPAVDADRHTWAGLEFVKVSQGKFTMGSHAKNRLAFGDERPRQLLNIPYDFWIGRFLVTKDQFSQFIDAARYSKKRYANWKYTSKHPVINTLWKDVHFYLRWLNAIYGSQLSEGLVFRLPTEAEWEKAARGVDGREWPWGNRFSRTLCNSGESEICTTTPVGTYSPPGDSPYGCADMAGNIWQWTQSLYRPYPYDPDDGRETLRGNGFRVVRGGSFYRDKQLVRCAYRKGVSTSTFAAGFRVVVGPPAS